MPLIEFIRSILGLMKKRENSSDLIWSAIPYDFKVDWFQPTTLFQESSSLAKNEKLLIVAYRSRLVIERVDRDGQSHMYIYRADV